MRVVFFGTPDFAVPSLKAIALNGHQIVGVVTRPDKPRGRGQKDKAAPPIVAAAREMKLKLFQPGHPKDDSLFQGLKEVKPEAIAVAAYGNLIPDRILDLAPRGTWNVHPSLLPRWRGPAPIHRTIWAGDEDTGVSIMRVTSRLDSGGIARQERIPLGLRETRGEVEHTLAQIGAEMLVRTLSDLATGEVRITEQDESRVTYAPVFTDEERRIRFDDLTSSEAFRLVRALEPSPGTYFLFRGERVKVLATHPCPHSNPALPGTLLERIPQGAWRIACREGSIWIESVQPEGKLLMSMDAFLAGRRLHLGDSLSKE